MRDRISALIQRGKSIHDLNRKEKKQLWIGGLVFVFLVNLYGLTYVLNVEDMGLPGQDVPGENHDLRFLINRIRIEGEPLKWFYQDWPLYNGFYRPIPTLSFFVDDAIYGNNLNGMKITNFVIAVIVAVALVWLVWELFQWYWFAIGCGAIFSFFQAGICNALPWENLAGVIAVGFLSVLLILRRGRWLNLLSTAGLVLLIGRELDLFIQQTDLSGQSIAYRTMGWPVGRTSTLLVMFALLSLAAYCRWERTSRKNWILISIISLLLALGCYEQVVVMPGAFLGCALLLRLQGIRVRWLWSLFIGALIAAYLYLHKTHLNWSHKYHYQALRSNITTIRDLGGWVFPAQRDAERLWSELAAGGLIAFTLVEPWIMLARITANLLAWIRVKERWLPIIFGLAMSIGVYAPLAFQKPLSHYFYFSACFRSIFVAGLIWLAYGLIVSGVSRQEQTTLSKPDQ